MADEITPEITARVAELSRLEITADQRQRFTQQLASILRHAEDINALDLSGVPPTSHPYPLKNVLREDEPSEGLDKNSVLDYAPETEAGQFKVPPILGEE